MPDQPIALELTFGASAGDTIEVTVPKDALVVPARASRPERSYPFYELAAPAVGTLRGSQATTLLELDAQVLITWNSHVAPQLYDVVVTAAPSPDDPTGDELEVVVEGWKVGAESDQPAFSAVLPATLQ